MKLAVRRAAAADLPTLLQIFDNARAFMRTHCVPTPTPITSTCSAHWKRAGL